MDTAQWPQEIGLVKPMEEMEMVPSSSTMVATASNTTRPQMMERRTRPQKEQALNCPRCNSTNTKFCYYNNYSLTQPRYFCKTCRRYWTEGGSLRNVPVGGGSRKNKRSSSSSTTNTPTSAVSTSKKMTPDHLIPPPSISLSPAAQNPKFHEGQDLNLAFHSLQPEFRGNNTSSGAGSTMNFSNPGAASGALSAMELLRSGMSGRGLGHFMPMQMSMADAGAVYSSGFGLQDYRPPTLRFPLDVTGGAGCGGGGGNGNGCGNMQGVQDGAGRLLFPFEDLKPVTTSTAAGQFEQNREQGGHDHPGYWNGMLGGGGGGGSW